MTRWVGPFLGREVERLPRFAVAHGALPHFARDVFQRARPFLRVARCGDMEEDGRGSDEETHGDEQILGV